MKLKAGRETTERGGHGVTRQLATMRSDNGVFWSTRGNSYVVVETADGYRLYSINGIGEIRWSVEEWNRDEESQAARAYFFEV